MTERIGIGILGAGNIAEKNIRAIGLTDSAQVVAVGSRDRAKAQAQIERCGLSGAATAYGSYDEVLADGRVAAVYITLPAALHLPWVLKAAAAGKSVLLEKPVAASAAELDAMLSACGGAGVQLMDGTMWSHSPRAARMAAVLRDAAAVGQLKSVTAAFTFLGGEEFMRSDVRVRSDCDPLGALGDLGWYCVRAMLWAFDWELPTAVAAHPGAVFNEQGVPMHVGATLLFPGGRRGSFECGFDRALTQTLEVGGTLGSIQLHDFVIPRSEQQSSFVVTTNHGLRDNDTWDATQRDTVVVHMDKPQEVFMWEAFCGLVARVREGGQPDPFWPRIAEATQRVLFAVERSARQGGCEVPVGNA